MNKLSFSLLLALLPTAFSTNAAAQNQVFEIVNTANTYEKVNFFNGDFAHVGTAIRDGIIDKEGREIIPCHLYTSSISSLSLYNEGRLLVKGDHGRYGYYDTEGKLVIPFIYKHAHNFNGGYASVENEDLRYGVIDKNGNTVVPFNYTYIGYFKDGMAPASKMMEGSSSYLYQLEGIIDIHGNEVIPLIYEDVDFFREGLARVEDKEGNFSFFDNKGRKVLSLSKGMWASEFYNGYAIVEDRNTKKYGVMDRTGKITVPCKFDDFDFSNFKEGVFVIKKEGHYGLIDEKGNLLTSVAYDYIFSYWTSGGLAKVRKDGKFGVLNRSGKEVIPCIYSGLELRYDGLISVKKGEKWYYIDEKGKSINPNEYDKTRPLSSGFTEVERDGKYGLIDMSGNLVIPCEYQELSYHPSLDLVMFKENGRYGFLDSKGTIVIPPIFPKCTHFNQDGVALTDNYVISLKNRPTQYMSYIEASEKGYADAQFFRGIYCLRKGNKEEGVKWLDMAVQQDLAVARHLMGSAYRNGWYGLEKNTGIAFLFESMAAEKGNIPAQVQVGLSYALADKYEEAIEWFRKAAASGSSDAYIYLGMCYEEGLGVERDLKEALRLYDWSFERDHNSRAQEAYRRTIEKMKQ